MNRKGESRPRPNRATEEIAPSRENLMEAKRAEWDRTRETLHEIFGQESIPEGVVTDLLNIRKTLSSGVDQSHYVMDTSSAASQIDALVDKIAGHQPTGGTPRDILKNDRAALRESLEAYFDSYRIVRNAAHFQASVRDLESQIVRDHAARRTNFYSSSERDDELIDRLHNRYAQTPFSHEELQQLVAHCHLPQLNALELQDISVLTKMHDVFTRFMKGDRTQYVALSAGLMIPAFINGYAPSFLIDSFKGEHFDREQLALYIFSEVASIGASFYLNKWFEKFLVKNFSEKGGVPAYIAENVVELSPQKITALGMEAVKQRIAHAKSSYQDVYQMVSYSILPAVVTLVTSACVLFDRSPLLAGSTIAGTGFTIALDRWLEKRTGWWNKSRDAQKKSEHLAQEMGEQMNAHMEIILSGMKDELSERVETLLSRERAASSEKSLARMIRNKASEFAGSMNLVTSGLVSALAGGTSGAFIAALAYSDNLRQGVERLMGARRNLLDNFRDMQEMELLFSGCAAEEAEKEKGRVGMQSVSSSAISLSAVEISVGDTTILSVPHLAIPAGSLTYLSGATGAGKTTLMKVISGYYKPTKGTVSIGEVDLDTIKKSGENSIYAAISYLPQFPYILSDTVRANLQFGLKAPITDEQIREVLREVGLDARFKNLNEQLGGGRGDTGTTSGGETSRIGLARLLLKIRNSDSRIVFLDEPTASLDDATKDAIARLLRAEKDKRPEVTFILISHDTRFVEQLRPDQRVQVTGGKVSEL